MINFDPTFASLIVFYLSPSMVGIMFCIVVFILLAILTHSFSGAKFMIAFDFLYEKVYKFYSDILGKEVGKNIKVYIASLFFVIFFANIAGVLLDFIAPIFGVSSD